MIGSNRKQKKAGRLDDAQSPSDCQNEEWFDKEMKFSGETVKAKVLRDEYRESEIDTFSTFEAIIEGKCGNCGSNRLKYFSKEPAGVVAFSCPVCDASDVDGENEDWDYEIGGQ